MAEQAAASERASRKAEAAAQRAQRDAELAREAHHALLALDGLLARVQHSLHAQREFAGNVAHELRTPLAGIRAQAAHALAQDDPAVWRSEL